MSHSQKQIVITTSELVTCFNRVLSVKECQSLFETSANAHHFRQSLSLAIYLTQKNENMMNARTALVQSAELLDTVLKTDLVSLYRHSHNHQSTATSNHSMSTKKLKIELLKLYEHILVVIEQCNATIIEDQEQQRQQQHHHHQPQQNMRHDPPPQSSWQNMARENRFGRSNTPVTQVNHRTGSTLSDNRSVRQSNHSCNDKGSPLTSFNNETRHPISPPISPQQQPQPQKQTRLNTTSSYNVVQQNKSSRLKRFMERVKLGVKSQSTSSAITEVSNHTQNCSNIDSRSNSSSKDNNNSDGSYASDATPAVFTVDTAPVHSKPQSSNDVHNLQQRLASLMSNNSASSPFDTLKHSNDVNMQSPVQSSGDHPSSNAMSLSELKHGMERLHGSNSSVLTTISSFYQRAIMHNTQLESVLKQQLQTHTEHHDQPCSLSGGKLLSRSSYVRIEHDIYFQLIRIVYEWQLTVFSRSESTTGTIASTIQRATTTTTTDETPSVIVAQYRKSLQIDDSTHQVIRLRCLVEKFDHSFFHLSTSLDQLREMHDSIVVVLKNQQSASVTSTLDDNDSTDPLLRMESLLESFISKCRTKMIDFSFFFGNLTFSTTTNDYSEDRGLECLEMMIQCLEVVLKMKMCHETVHSKEHSPSLAQLLTEWIRVSSDKLYRINNEETHNLLVEKSHKRGIVFDGTQVLYQCEFVSVKLSHLYVRFQRILTHHLQCPFIELICHSFHSQLTEQIDAFLSMVDRHQVELLDKMKHKTLQSVVDFQVPLALFHRVCSSVNKAFRDLRHYCPILSLYPLHRRFYVVIQRCITHQTSGRLKNLCIRAIENDNMAQPYESSVLYTKSCVDVVNGCFELLNIVSDIERVVHDKGCLTESLLSDYFGVVHSVISIFLEHTSTQFRYILMGPNEESEHIRTMNDKIRTACSYFNNINGIFTLCQNRLTKFNNTTFMQIYMSEGNYDGGDNGDGEDAFADDDEDALLDSLDGAPVDVFDLEGVSSLMNALQTTANSIALFFAQFIYMNNERKLRALIKHFDEEVLHDLLMSLDRFFTVTSQFLYIEQLHEVLKHLYVIYIQVCFSSLFILGLVVRGFYIYIMCERVIYVVHCVAVHYY